VDGGCSSTSGTNNEICDGISVLNDGILPALSGVNNDPASQWASELFTMRRSENEQIILSFEVPSGRVHNQVELTVFNCPEQNIYAPQVIVYTASSLDVNANLEMAADVALSEMSCEHLWKFCVKIGGVGVPNLKLVFPHQNNSDMVFLGEVTFINIPVQNSPCDPPQLITMRVPPNNETIGKYSIIVTICAHLVYMSHY
jgi:hypothetical protein